LSRRAAQVAYRTGREVAPDPEGWTEGVQLMVEGEKARFWIPENLAYQGQQPPYGLLVFDVELLQIR
jgi:FKBP-type peptidyl-prolyl cis-trans isomerase